MESEIFSQLRSGINNDLTVSLADVQPDPVFPAAAAADASPDDDNDSADEANGVEHHENMHTDIDLASDDLFPALPAASAAPTTRKPLSASWRPAVSKQPELVPGTVRKLGSGKRVSEAVHIPLDMQQKLPSVGRNSIPDLAKAIALHSQTTIDVSANRSTFVITGKPESIKVARKELVSAIGVVLTETVHVPASVRPHILGAGGKNLKDLISRTGVQITVPKPKADSASPTASSTAFDDDDDQPVTIKGNYEGVKEARKEIEDIVLKRTQNLSSRLIIERSFHPFIAGPNNSTVEAIEEKTGTRIHIPPLVTPAPAANSEKKEKNLNEIVIVGSRESIRFAEAELRALHEKLERDTQTLAFPVKKRQHRFIIGTKGKNLQDILEQTGCSVELPSASDPSDMVTVRGPDNMLSVALQFVLQKSNQVSLEEIDVSSIIPQSLDPAHFLRFVFTKEQALIKRIESAHSVSIHRLTASGSSASSGDSFVLEIQGKTKAEAEAAKIELSAALRDMARTLYFGHVEIPRGLHRHVVGKGGQNIARMRALEAWGGRLVDVVVHGESASVEGTAAEDEVVIVARRQIINPKSAAAKGKSAAALAEEEEEEARAFVEKVRDEILSVSLASAEFTSETIRVDGKFHGRIIGAGGKDLKELLAPYGDEVSVRFPPASGVGIADKEKKEENGPAPATTNKKMTIEPNTIVIRGPKKLVAEVKDILTKTIAELKRIETLASFSDTLKVKKGLGRKLLQGAGAPVSAGSNIVNDSGFGGGNRDSIGWLIRLVKESLAANPPKQAGDVTHEDTHLIALLKVTVAESTTSSGDDVLTVTGPKNVVLTAKKILADRAVRLASQVTVEVKIFTACSAAARAVLSENAVADLKDRVLRRLIGKGGKNVNALMEKYAVSVQFPESGNKKKRNGAVKADEAEDDGADVDGDDSTASDDLVVIKGSPKDVEAAKAEIMKTVENEIVKSFIMSFEVPRSVLPRVLGASGSKIKALREEHDVRIDFNDLEGDDGEITVMITLEGSKKDCLAVEKKIRDTTDELVNVVVKDILVPSYLHKDVIGPSGSRIKPIIEQFGGQSKVKVNFPLRADASIWSAEADKINCKAHVSQIDQLVAEIFKLVNEILAGEEGSGAFLIDQETQETISEEVIVSKTDATKILGRGGDYIKDSSRKFLVNYWFSEADADHVIVKVVGLSGNTNGVAQAAEDLKGKMRASARVSLPDKVSDKVRENLAAEGPVRDEEVASIQDVIKRVRLDSAGFASAEVSHGALEGAAGGFITIRGDAKHVSLAVRSVEKALAEMSKYDVTLRVPIDASIRGHIIGKAGATIGKIRSESGANVELSKTSSRSGKDVAVIRGSAAAVEKAKELVEKIIDDQNRFASEFVKRGQALSNGPARIDDEPADDGSVTSAPAQVTSGTYIPGFVPGQKQQKGAKPVVPVTATTTRTTYYASSAANGASQSVVVDSWKSVTKKGRKEDDTVVQTANGSSAAADSVPGAAPSKKKKKKATNGAAATDSPVANGGHSTIDSTDEFVTSEVVEQSIRAPSPVKEIAVVAATVAPQAKPVPKTPESPKQLPVPPSVVPPVVPIAAAVVSPPTPQAAPAVFASEPPADDGWTVISKKGTAPAAAALVVPAESSGEGKKKKKNKKKKKASAGSAENRDDGDDDE